MNRPGTAKRKPSLGLRREALAVLPLAALLLAGVALFTLNSYGSAMESIGAAHVERLRVEAAAIAAGFRSREDLAALRRRYPELIEIRSAASPRGQPPADRGPDLGQDLVLLRTTNGVGEPIEIVFDNTLLASQRRALRLLQPLALLAIGAATILLLLFLRRLFKPIDLLMERAHAAGIRATGIRATPGDEVAFLLATFEESLGALRERGSPMPEELAERLHDSLRRVGEVSAGVAHEMRNGLATIVGYLGLLERRWRATGATTGGKEKPEEITEIRQEVANLERVVEDFLAFARPGSARPETIDLVEQLRRAAADPALGERPIEWRLPAGEELRTIADPVLLDRAIRNLLRNAVEASPTGSAIEVTIRRTEKTAEISIGDRGKGLPPGQEDAVLEPFVSARAGGAGLGLPIARRIAALHGGTLRLANRPGGGVLATLSLPAERSD
jgi:signal transduction histidine kinase